MQIPPALLGSLLSPPERPLDGAVLVESVALFSDVLAQVAEQPPVGQALPHAMPLPQGPDLPPPLMADALVPGGLGPFGSPLAKAPDPGVQADVSFTALIVAEVEKTVTNIAENSIPLINDLSVPAVQAAPPAMPLPIMDPPPVRAVPAQHDPDPVATLQGGMALHTDARPPVAPPPPVQAWPPTGMPVLAAPAPMNPPQQLGDEIVSDIAEIPQAGARSVAVTPVPPTAPTAAPAPLPPAAQIAHPALAAPIQPDGPPQPAPPASTAAVAPPPDDLPGAPPSRILPPVDIPLTPLPPPAPPQPTSPAQAAVAPVVATPTLQSAVIQQAATLPWSDGPAPSIVPDTASAHPAADAFLAPPPSSAKLPPSLAYPGASPPEPVAPRAQAAPDAPTSPPADGPPRVEPQPPTLPAAASLPDAAPVPNLSALLFAATATGTPAIAPLPDTLLPQGSMGAPLAAPGLPPSPPVMTQQGIPLPDHLVHLVQSAPDGPVTLTLRPDDLGTLRFDVQHSADGMSVHLTVERSETLDLLRRHAEQLTDAFRQAGFAGASFTFGGGEGGQRERPTSQSPAQWPEPIAETAGPMVTGLLDMRL